MSERERVYCDVRGFVVDTSSHGSPGNTDPTASCYTYHITESGKFGTGHFSIHMAGLKPGTKYYYRACCKRQVEMHLARKTILHLLERKKWFNPPLLFEF